MTRHRLWTTDSILAAVRAFVAREGTFPSYLDFCRRNQLPSHDTVERYFATATDGGHTALRRAYVALAHPNQASDAKPNWCLRCQQVRLRRGVHLCQRCQDAPPVPDGAWMNSPVPEGLWDLTDGSWDLTEWEDAP